jgi:hypothetical protein
MGRTSYVPYASMMGTQPDFKPLGLAMGNSDGAASFDLSKATKLRHAVFRLHRDYPIWITMALKTIASERTELRISLHVPVYRGSIASSFDEEVGRQWADLEFTLIRLWESHGVRTRVVYDPGEEKGEAREYIERLLPEVMKRGIIELVVNFSSQ